MLLLKREISSCDDRKVCFNISSRMYNMKSAIAYAISNIIT